jgi:TPR repeat protein
VLSNHSVPSLPSEQRHNPDQIPEPIPARLYDPTSALDTFHALRIDDSLGKPPSNNVHVDPIPRSTSPMSLLSSHHGSSRRGPSLPSNPRPHPRHPVTASRNADYSSTYDAMSLPSWRGFNTPSGQLDDPSSTPSLNPPSVPPFPGDYNRLYAAASDVLGISPPPQSVYQRVDHPESAEHHYNRSESTHIPGHFSIQHDDPSSPISLYPRTSSPPSHPSSISAEIPSDVPELEKRPTSDRPGHFSLEALPTRTTKAVDLRAPPFTKEYIDDYRQRIKADPDPEAHFAYARYLIDAAKKIGAEVKDQRAVRKYRDTLIQESLRVIKRLATQGQPYDDAQFFLANCYGTGMLGLQVDHEKAYHLYLQAAKQNHAAATYRVAVCNEIGVGTRKEPPRAAAFYRKAASLGDTAAMYKLGMILLQGSLGEGKNVREAVGWLRRAAEQADVENPHALHELALLHEATIGQIVPHDPLQAKEYFSRAAYLGYTQSQHKLGQCYEFGTLGCPVDPRRSIAWYTKAAEKGNAAAELALSGWYLTGSEGVLKQSDSEAYLWARRAANKGLAKAEYAVGYYAEVGIGIKQDIEFAKRWYMRAAGT